MRHEHGQLIFKNFWIYQRLNHNFKNNVNMKNFWYWFLKYCLSLEIENGRINYNKNYVFLRLLGKIPLDRFVLEICQISPERFTKFLAFDKVSVPENYQNSGVRFTFSGKLPELRCPVHLFRKITLTPVSGSHFPESQAEKGMGVSSHNKRVFCSSHLILS